MSKSADGALVALGARAEDGDDAGYLAWHALDHRPELHRLPTLRASLRVVSTPACRAARAASAEPYDAVDHVMAYLFGSADTSAFAALGKELAEAGKVTRRIPSVGFGRWTHVGSVAAPHVVSGADTLPWRPALGAYLVIGPEPVEDVLVPGVAGAWSFEGDDGWLTWCFLDAEPVAVAERLAPKVGDALLAAPFHTVEPWQWDRHLP
jgi:hypothetical protein